MPLKSVAYLALRGRYHLTSSGKHMRALLRVTYTVEIVENNIIILP